MACYVDAVLGFFLPPAVHYRLSGTFVIRVNEDPGSHYEPYGYFKFKCYNTQVTVWNEKRGSGLEVPNGQDYEVKIEMAFDAPASFC